MKKKVLIFSLILLYLLSCNPKGKPWSRKDLMKYFDDEKVVELVLAANKGDIKKIDELVKKGVDVNYKGKKDVTPLFAQISSLNLQGFKRLLEHGADPNIPAEDGSSVMWYVACGGEVSKETLPMLKLCLEHNGNPNWVYRKEGRDEKGFERFEDGRPILCAAILYNDYPLEAVKILLDAGADINIKDKMGQNALWYARCGGHYDVLYYLLKRGADYLAKDNYGKNFIWSLEEYPNMAAGGSKKELERQRIWKKKVIEFLKEKGIEVHLKYPD